jgi:hypothetical protein
VCFFFHKDLALRLTATSLLISLGVLLFGLRGVPFGSSFLSGLLQNSDEVDGRCFNNIAVFELYH